MNHHVAVPSFHWHGYAKYKWIRTNILSSLRRLSTYKWTRTYPSTALPRSFPFYLALEVFIKQRHVRTIYVYVYIRIRRHSFSSGAPTKWNSSPSYSFFLIVLLRFISPFLLLTRILGFSFSYSSSPAPPIFSSSPPIPSPARRLNMDYCFEPKAPQKISVAVHA